MAGCWAIHRKQSKGVYPGSSCQNQEESLPYRSVVTDFSTVAEQYLEILTSYLDPENHHG